METEELVQKMRQELHSLPLFDPVDSGVPSKSDDKELHATNEEDINAHMASTAVEKESAAADLSDTPQSEAVGANSQSDDVITNPPLMEGALASHLIAHSDGKEYKPMELYEALMPTLELLICHEPESLPFQKFVDPAAVPNYKDIIQEPMDLVTIREKLNCCMYTNPWKFVSDVWLMFDNAWRTNKTTSKVYKYCTKLSTLFESLIDPVMKSLGYCCGRTYVFNVPVSHCDSKQNCTIARDAGYYTFRRSVNYCEDCFHGIEGGEIELPEDQNMILDVHRKHFEKLENKQDPEPFVLCQRCQRAWHQVCALHLEQSGQPFRCDSCIKATGRTEEENSSTARELQRPKLEAHLEMRVKELLRRTYGQHGDVTIRVLSSGKKLTHVRPQMLTKLHDKVSRVLPYQAKAIIAVQEIEGVDVCFFAMHVQEYGSSCPKPNTRRVYISYVDTVPFFQPPYLQTAVHHEILIGYLEHVKQLGYTTAHAWACPASEGVDFFFHCRPPQPRTLNPQRVQEWFYTRTLDKAVKRRVIIDYKDLYQDAKDSNLTSATQIPYFEGDYWPHAIEKITKDFCRMEQEQEKKDGEEAKADASEAKVSMGTVGDSPETRHYSLTAHIRPCPSPTTSPPHIHFHNQMRAFTLPTLTDLGEHSRRLKATHLRRHRTAVESLRRSSGMKPGKKKEGKKNKKKKKKEKPMNESNEHQATQANSEPLETRVTTELLCVMEKYRNLFFVIRLNDHQDSESLPAICDPDPPLPPDVITAYERFVTVAREKHYEFSSLRRAKLSSMALLFNLSTQEDDREGPQRYVCMERVDEEHRCSSCEGRAMCPGCYHFHDHSHEKDKCQEEDKARAWARSLVKEVELLEHALTCQDPHCLLDGCCAMKKGVQHSRNCTQTGVQECSTCDRLLGVCFTHALHCKEGRCTLPMCRSAKVTSKHQRWLWQFDHLQHQTHVLRHRVAVMTSGTAEDTTAVPVKTRDVDTDPQPSPQAAGEHTDPNGAREDMNLPSPQGAIFQALMTLASAQGQALGLERCLDKINVPFSVADKPPTATMQPPAQPSGELSLPVQSDHRPPGTAMSASSSQAASTATQPQPAAPQLPPQTVPVTGGADQQPARSRFTTRPSLPAVVQFLQKQLDGLIWMQRYPNLAERVHTELARRWHKELQERSAQQAQRPQQQQQEADMAAPNSMGASPQGPVPEQRKRLILKMMHMTLKMVIGLNVEKLVSKLINRRVKGQRSRTLSNDKPGLED